MTIRRRPRPQRRRQITAFLLSGAVLYLVAATASSPTARSALEALGRRGGLALNLLRCQLGDLRTEMPAPVALAIAQSPALLAGREAVLELRRTGETEDSAAPSQPDEPAEPAVPSPAPAEGTVPPHDFLLHRAAGDAAGVRRQRRRGKDPGPGLRRRLSGDGGRVHQQPQRQQPGCLHF